MALTLTGEQGAASAQQLGSLRSRHRAGGSKTLGVPKLKSLTLQQGQCSTDRAPLLPQCCCQHLKGGKSGGGGGGGGTIRAVGDQSPRAIRSLPGPRALQPGILRAAEHRDALGRASRRDPAGQLPPVLAQAALMLNLPGHTFHSGTAGSQTPAALPAGTCCRAGGCGDPSAAALRSGGQWHTAPLA